jgi:hypothetical protein
MVCGGLITQSPSNFTIMPSRVAADNFYHQATFTHTVKDRIANMTRKHCLEPTPDFASLSRIVSEHASTDSGKYLLMQLLRSAATSVLNYLRVTCKRRINAGEIHRRVFAYAKSILDCVYISFVPLTFKQSTTFTLCIFEWLDSGRVL